MVFNFLGEFKLYLIGTFKIGGFTDMWPRIPLDISIRSSY